MPRATKLPMDVLSLPPACAAGSVAPVLLVMLPGAYSRPEEFVDEGFSAAVRSCGLAADIVVADAHLGYYNDRSVLQRLRDDVIVPARARGVRRIWLVGISLGGFGALGYGARHGSEVADGIDGIVALAPYLGRRELLREIAEAGGPAAWARAAPPHGDDLERELWQWLAGRGGGPPVYLGHGRDDRFAETNRLLRSVLPADRGFEAPGGHDWPVWRALWAAWLDRGLLPRTCAAVP